MIRLGLWVDTINMTVSIPDDNLGQITTLVAYWALKRVANIHELRTTLAKLFYIAQCCPPARFFFNRILDML